jgi:hypothetical protein
MKFKGTVECHQGKVYYNHVKVPDDIYEKVTQDGQKRILCHINDHDYFHAGLLPTGDGTYYIILSKARMKEFNIELGQSIDVKIEKDKSKYGMKMPPEFEEVLETDEEGLKHFENLTDGKKRNLIHLIAMTKNTDIRITKALTILDHLKANEGALDFKLLNEALKVSNRKY